MASLGREVYEVAKTNSVKREAVIAIAGLTIALTDLIIAIIALVLAR